MRKTITFLKKTFTCLLALMLMFLSIHFDVDAATNTGELRYTVLILDTSGSMKGTPLEVQKEAAINFCETVLSAKGINYVAIVRLNSSSDVGCEFTDNLDILTNYINGITANGGTNINQALEVADTLLTSVMAYGATKNIVLCSDGLPENGVLLETGPFIENDGPDFYAYANKAFYTAVELRSKAYNIYTLGFFHSLEQEALTLGKKFMKSIASSDNNYYEIVDANALEFVFGSIADTVTGQKDSEESYYQDLTEWVMDKGTQNMIKYLCFDNNFSNSIFTYENDSKYSSGLIMTLTDMYYRGIDGWRDIFNAGTSKNEAEKIIVALLEGYQSQCDILAKEKTAQKYASLIVNGYKDFLNADSVSLANSAEIEKFTKIVDEKTIKQILLEGEYDSLIKNMKQFGGYTDNDEIIKSLNRYMKSNDFTSDLSKGLSFLGKGLELLSVTENTVNLMYQVESLNQADEMYLEMLLYLKENCVFEVVQDAAAEVYEVANGSIERQKEYVIDGLKGGVMDIAIDSILEYAIDSLPFVNIISKGFSWGADLSNILFKTSDIQELTDNMRITAYIGQCLSLWTLSNLNSYMSADANNQKRDYADKIYFGLYMVLGARQAGEESLQNMMKKLGSVYSPYYNLSLQISSTLDVLKEKLKADKRNCSILRVCIACPVDVEVYDSDGTLVLSLKDGKEQSGNIDDIYYNEYYQPLDDDYVKIIHLPNENRYSIKSIGSSIGLVDCSIAKISEGAEKHVSFENVKVDSGSIIYIDKVTASEEEYTYSDSAASERVSYSFKKTSNEYVEVTDINIKQSFYQVKTGGQQLIDATVFPENATKNKIAWISKDNSIATVNGDGIVTGVSAGKTQIKGIVDGVEKTLDIQVVSDNTVLKKGRLLKDSYHNAWFRVIAVNGKKIKLEYVSPVNENAKKITIPNKINHGHITYYVTKIANSAFKGCKKLQMVTLGSNVEKIGKQAFINCIKLNKIIIKSKKLTSKGVSKNAFAGLGKVTIKVPKQKLKIYRKIFRKKGLGEKAIIKQI